MADVSEDLPRPELAQIAAVAARVLVGQMRAAEAARLLSDLRFAVSEDGSDQDFTIFVVLDSETDHLPVGAERDAHWSPEVLPKLDAELRDIEAFYLPDVLESCARLVERFSSAA